MRMAGAGTTSASDDHLNKLVKDIQNKFEGLSPPSDCCIFTVPEKLRQINKDAYTPHVVAIGPYHRVNPSLMPMEDHKLWYLQNFLQQNQNCHLKDYIERVKSWEDEARNCYDKQIDLKSDQFTEMMLLDGIFVIQLFLTYWRRQIMPGDRIFDKPWMLNDVCRDMALLENQMPFFAVQRLFEMAFGTHPKHVPGLLELTCGFFKPVMRMEKLPESVIESEVKHFVDAIRLSFFPSVRNVPYEINKEIEFSPGAMDLKAAGVKLKRVESKCLMDIKFENGELKIPELALYDRTESFFRNIIAFEQCYHQTDRYLTSYVIFMDHLVDTPADAKLLIDKGIIKNWLSNEEAAADLINAFCKEISLGSNDYYFYSLSNELVKHCQWPYNEWKAALKRDYCSNPWLVISVIAAVVLLLLTVAQTVFSVLSYI